uniref:Large ribosomal subunit protein mL42 n=1 Tax=Panagrolaimus sp. JU765 TaxID=591449 RepID=A0AC34PUT4_9BILA
MEFRSLLRPRFVSVLQYFRTKSNQSSSTDWQTVTLKNGVVASWHPHKEFPYQYTRPIDLVALENQRQEEEKLRKIDPEEARFKDKNYGPTGPDNLTLRRIFHANKTEFTTRTREDRLYQTAAPIPPLWLGRQKFLSGLAVQEKLFQYMNSKKHSGIVHEHYLCLFEHFPTYTVGLRGHLYSKEEEQELISKGAEFHRIKRGGMITFHGPGQLVAYPIFDLRNMRLKNTTSATSFVGVKAFVDSIEEILIRLLTTDFQIENVGRTSDTGVWIDGNRKIAAIGIQVRHGITSHGLALNCNTDLSWFDNIVPCGLAGKTVTSISNELKQNVSIDEVIHPFCKQFEEIFDCQVNLCQEMPQLDNDSVC